LARARIRVMRSEISLNQAIIDAYEEHTANLVEIVGFIERNMTRLNVQELLRIIPGLTPPVLRRQSNGYIRTPLRDITNTLFGQDANNENEPN